MFFHSTENWKRRGRAKHFSRYSGKSQPTPNFILARGSVSEQENQGPTTSCWLVQRQGQPRPGLRIPSYCQARSLASVAFLAKDLLLRVTHLLCPVCSSTGSPWGKWEWGQWDRTQQELRWGKMNSLMSGDYGTAQMAQCSQPWWHGISFFNCRLERQVMARIQTSTWEQNSTSRLWQRRQLWMLPGNKLNNGRELERTPNLLF